MYFKYSNVELIDKVSNKLYWQVDDGYMIKVSKKNCKATVEKVWRDYKVEFKQYKGNHYICI